MKIAESLLYRLARSCPHPRADKQLLNGARAGSEEYENAYCRLQLEHRFRRGIDVVPTDLSVLEIGCGHGGIACYLALAGAKRVVGIDINRENLTRAEQFAELTARRFGAEAKLAVEFLEMDAYNLTFPAESFDLVVSDNSFEHFMQPDRVMQQAFQVLRPGGHLVVPSFSSIYSKYGLHLKEGLHAPWANLFFSQQTIIHVMQRLVREDPHLESAYPGVFRNPQHVRDLRPYGDLNDITFSKFKRMASDAGFKMVRFRPFSTLLGKVVARTPLLKNTRLNDILSIGASALLQKPTAS